MNKKELLELLEKYGSNNYWINVNQEIENEKRVKELELENEEIAKKLLELADD